MALASSSCEMGGWSATEAREPDLRRGTDRHSVLVAETEPGSADALRALLASEGYAAETAPNQAALLDAVGAREFDAVLMGLDQASSGDGDLLTEISTLDPATSIVVLTPAATANVATDIVSRLVGDFVETPWQAARVATIVRNQVALAAARRRERRLEAENALLRPVMPTLVAEAPAMHAVVNLVSRVAPSRANVLITGEVGSGRNLIARTLHTLSPRAARAFVTLDVAATPGAALDAEIFGRDALLPGPGVDRVGRFELADGGTLFIDEVAGVPLALQPKVLRAIETGRFERLETSRTRRADVRVVSASSVDLDPEVAAGRLRQDLLLRLNTVEIAVPPLRERREDIPVLARQFLRVHAQRCRKTLDGFDPGALEALLAYGWPGNVRELDQIIERGVRAAAGPAVRRVDLGLRTDGDVASRLEDMSLEDVEAFLINKALARYEGNVSHAAKALGLSRSALYRRLQRYGL